ncbi:hypothetical protein TNIN_428791 [Trichonephila inaurata madagascariensis]|uniref:Uncharacterized protein n=1 Tax=Trichonephila inaurata madagascariensis TaxID=2747483 RepID=A0A8X7CGJ4_9ARAC|nr:hypothetical protein TNIN_428791 [Trichonephila inaurata madagascariensis]
MSHDKDHKVYVVQMCRCGRQPGHSNNKSSSSEKPLDVSKQLFPFFLTNQELFTSTSPPPTVILLLLHKLRDQQCYGKLHISTTKLGKSKDWPYTFSCTVNPDRWQQLEGTANKKEKETRRQRFKDGYTKFGLLLSIVARDVRG